MSDFFGKKSSDIAKSKYQEVEKTFSRSVERQITLPPLFSAQLLNDPKWIGFTLSRHKFVGKMFNQMEKVLEVGCWEGICSIVVAQHVKQLITIDYYKPHINNANKAIKPFVDNIDYRGHDILDGPVEENTFDGAFSLDVLEHIDPKQEVLFMQQISKSLKPDGVFIVGIPSLNSQQYASEGSKLTHINCKTGEQLDAFCKRFYKNVFMFGMNDEVLHTGFLPMCQYFFAICVGKKME